MEMRQGRQTQNPYLNRVAIKDPAQLFGRTREIARIFSRLGASRPQSISLVGERRIGKSSLLYYINNRAMRERFLDSPASSAFAFIDLQQKRKLTPDEFFKEMFSVLAGETEDESLTGLDYTYDSVRVMLEKFRKRG
ncbi:MAG TPA: hypothetical protein VI756_25225, partial [Blastocatellia bacterium]